MTWNNAWTEQYRGLGELPKQVGNNFEDARDLTDAETLGVQLLGAKRKLPGASLSEIHDVILYRR